MKICTHQKGDYISEKGFWLCLSCWKRFQGRPVRYGLPIKGLGADGPPQDIVWRAERAKSDCGMFLNDFLRIMAKRIMTRTRPMMDKSDAYEAAIEMLKSWPDPFGHPDYDWSASSAREMVDEEMQHWDLADGNT